MIKIPAEQRRGKLRSILKEKEFLRAIETVNGLEGLIAENTKMCDENANEKEFDALWLSGFCHAAFKGMPDNESVDISEKLSAVKEIFAVSSKPLIIDMDTGGNVGRLCNNIKMLEKLGVSAAVIEDKTGSGIHDDQLARYEKDIIGHNNFWRNEENRKKYDVERYIEKGTLKKLDRSSI